MRAVALLGAAAMLGTAPPAAAAEHRGEDEQIWTELDLAIPLSRTLSATAFGALRAGRDVPNPTLSAAGLTVEADLGSGCSASAGALWAHVRSPVDGAGRDLALPLVALSCALKRGPVRVALRSRLERILGVPAGPWRERTRLSVSVPIGRHGPLTAVSASDEVFYDFTQHAFSRNRAQVGLVFTPAPRTQLETYYLRQNDRTGRFSALNVLGLALRYILR